MEVIVKKSVNILPLAVVKDGKIFRRVTGDTYYIATDECYPGDSTKRKCLELPTGILVSIYEREEVLVVDTKVEIVE